MRPPGDDKPRRKGRSATDRLLENAERLERQMAPIYQAQALDQTKALGAAGMDHRQFMDDLRSRFGAAQAFEYASAAHTARDHLDALMDDVLGLSDMTAEAFAPPSAADTVRQGMDEILQLTNFEPSANIRATLDALDGLPDPVRRASDPALTAVTELADAGVLSMAQTDKVSAFLDSPQTNMENLLGNLARQLDEVTSFQTAPFQETLRESLVADYGAQAMAQATATDQIQRHLSTVLDAAGLTPWIESLQHALAEPDSFEIFEQFRSAGEQVTAELQSLLARELYKQPDWRTLMEAASGINPEPIDEDASAPEAQRTNRWRLKREFLVAYKKVSEILSAKGIRLKPSPATLLAVVGIALTMNYGTQSSQENVEVRRDLSNISHEIETLLQGRRWLLARNDRIQLRVAPFASANQVSTYGPALLHEKQKSGDWVEVTIYGRDGETGTGWVEQSELDLRDSTAEPGCDTDHIQVAPVLIVEAGANAQEAWQTFFLAKLRNPNTRKAYWRACTQFLAWCRSHGLMLETVRPGHVASWRDELLEDKSTATVKQYLTAVRRLLDEIAIVQVIESNPAIPVSAPSNSVPRAKTASLSAAELRQLFDSFENGTVADLRDRAVLAVMAFCLAQVSAVCSIRVGDIELSGRQPHLNLGETRGRQHRIPLNDTLVEWIGAYVEAVGIGDERDSPLFRSFGRGRGATAVTGRELSRQDVYAIVRRRFGQAGLERSGGCQTLRATGITQLLKRGVPIGLVAELAGHASTDITRRYDGRI